MRTVIFDTESSLYWPMERGLSSVQVRRNWVLSERIIFDCAAMLHLETGVVEECCDPCEVVSALQMADRIVSYNGKRVDLPVLENKCGKDAVAALWDKPHCDLIQVCDWSSLEVVSQGLSCNTFAVTEQEWLNRVRLAVKLWPDVNGFSPAPQRLEFKIAKAVCDVKRIKAVLGAVEVLDWHWRCMD